MIVYAVDWTNVLDTAIATIPAIIAALYARSVHTQVKTPSGTAIGKQVEHAHLTAIANNHLLARSSRATKSAVPETIQHEIEDPPQVPDESQQDSEH